MSPEEVLTPAATAVQLCRERGFERVALLVADALREDLAELDDIAADHLDAVILGDLGAGFDDAVLNRAFRWLMQGAALVALQHNRFYRRGGGLVLDVGAYAAALEYATGREAIVAGKPSAAFFGAVLAQVGVDAAHAVMVGDDVEADVGGALDAGLERNPRQDRQVPRRAGRRQRRPPHRDGGLDRRRRRPFRRLMRAMLFDGPGRPLRLADVPEPEPGPGRP